MILMLAASQLAKAQKMTATFDDGTKIDYELVEKELSQMHHWAVELPTRLDVGYRLLAVYYYSPEKFRASAFIGFGTYGADGIYYLNSWSKQKPLNLPLKSSYTGANTTTTYYARIPDARRTFYMGPHLAINQNKWKTDRDSIQGTSIGLGWALTRGRHAKWIIQGRKRPISVRGTSFNSLIFDLNYFAGLRNISTASQSYTPQPVGDISTPFGVKLYYEGRTSFVMHREFGIHYSVGYSLSANKKAEPIAGFGFYFGF